MLRKTSLVLLVVAAVHIAVGGAELVAQGEFPYQASLQRYNLGAWYHSCSGAIVSAYHVLTTASCAISLDPSNGISALVGTKDLTVGGSRHKVIDVMPHPEYDSSGIGKNDIAICKVENQFDLDSPYVGFASLATTDVILPGTHLTLTSWGPFPELQKTDFNVLDNSECALLDSGFSLDFNFGIKFCADEVEQQAGSCGCDRGGPLTHNGELVGVMSLWKSSTSAGIAGVFMNVGFFNNWIKQHITE